MVAEISLESIPLDPRNLKLPTSVSLAADVIFEIVQSTIETAARLDLGVDQREWDQFANYDDEDYELRHS